MKNISDRRDNFHVELPFCGSHVLKICHGLLGDPMAWIHIEHLRRDVPFAIADPQDTVRAGRPLFTRFTRFTFRSGRTLGTNRTSHTPRAFFSSPPGWSIRTIHPRLSRLPLSSSPPGFPYVPLVAFGTGDSIKTISTGRSVGPLGTSVAGNS